MKTKITLLKMHWIILCSLCMSCSFAQTWQWGKRGGGDGTISDSYSTERVKRIVTDSHGNVYALCPVSSPNLDIDGNPKTGYSQANSVDYAIVSFACDGTYRWSKIIGGYSSDYVNGLAVDAQDNVYVAGRVLPTEPGVTTVHFDTDFALQQSPFATNTFKRGLFVVKYNSNGILQWTAWPQIEDVPAINTFQSFSLAFSVSPEGNSSWLLRLKPGLYAGSYNVSTADTYHVLHYDSNGNFTGGIPISMVIDNTSLNFVKMAINHQTGTIYLAGFITPDFGGAASFNGQSVMHDMYLAAYNSSGQFLWKKESTQNQSRADGFQDIYINTNGDIYLTGATATGMGFGTYTFSALTLSNFPFILKTNANGEVIWGTNAESTAHGYSYGISEGAAIGTFAGTTTWDSFSISVPPNTFYDVYMTRFNPDTGAILALETLTDDDGYNDAGTAITKDAIGNFYVGGRFEHLLYVNSATPMVNDGLQTDFFIAKFGSNNCALGVEDNSKPGLQVYPNPVRGLLHVTGFVNEKYVLYDMRGVIVKQGTVANETIAVDGIAVGVYVLEIDGVRMKVVIN